MKNRVNSYVEQIINAMEAEQPFDAARVLATLRDLRERLEVVYKKYEGSIPDGTEEIQQTMLDGLQLLYRGLEDLEMLVLGEPSEEDLVVSALSNCQEAEDCFKVVDDLAEQVTATQPGFMG
ncbi:MAG: hypothetical protein AB7S38_27335 [Vulcanimicrobiota bacterium]